MSENKDSEEITEKILSSDAKIIGEGSERIVERVNRTEIVQPSGNKARLERIKRLDPKALVMKKTREEMKKWINPREKEQRQLALRKNFSRMLGKQAAKEIIVHEKYWPLWTDDKRELVAFQGEVPQVAISHLEFAGKYAELEDERLSTIKGGAKPSGIREEEENYQFLNEMLIQGRHNEFFDIAELCDMQHDEDLRLLVEEMKRRPDLRECVRNLVRAMIYHSNQTGDVIDIFGKNNVILFDRPHGEGYAARFIDPLHPNAFLIPAAKEVLVSLSSGNMLNTDEIKTLLNVFNYARTVNGLAIELDLPDRVEILPEKLKGKDIYIDFGSFTKVIKKAVEKMNAAAAMGKHANKPAA